MSRRVPRSRATAAVDTATRRAVMVRDAGLRRISAVTRWAAAAVIALSGGLALVAAKGFHGHAATASSSSTRAPATTTPATTTPATTTPSTTTPATTTPATTTPAIQQPAQAPAPVQQVPVVVSGGS